MSCTLENSRNAEMPTHHWQWSGGLEYDPNLPNHHPPFLRWSFSFLVLHRFIWQLSSLRFFKQTPSVCSAFGLPLSLTLWVKRTMVFCWSFWRWKNPKNPQKGIEKTEKTIPEKSWRLTFASQNLHITKIPPELSAARGCGAACKN